MAVGVPSPLQELVFQLQTEGLTNIGPYMYTPYNRFIRSPNALLCPLLGTTGGGKRNFTLVTVQGHTNMKGVEGGIGNG